MNANAVLARLAHGDYLPDADGDGYTAEGACAGSMDAGDASVHPGAEEVFLLAVASRKTPNFFSGSVPRCTQRRYMPIFGRRKKRGVAG